LAVACARPAQSALEAEAYSRISFFFISLKRLQTQAILSYIVISSSIEHDLIMAGRYLLGRDLFALGPYRTFQPQIAQTIDVCMLEPESYQCCKIVCTTELVEDF